MIKKAVLVWWIFTNLIISDSFSQSRAEIKNMFYEAESWILFEDYEEALPLYLQLLKFYPTNTNYKFRIGQCYINTPGEKEKAITYLEDAVKDIDPKYKEGRFKETQAPYDAQYYLANAYRINNQLDKALETYHLFKANLDPAVYDSAVVNLQIQSCLNAKDLMSSPLYVKKENLGSYINEDNSEFYPVISDNEDLLVFSKAEAFYDAILYSQKVDGVWSGPLNMNEILKVDRDLFPTSLSKDGQVLYLYSSADYDGIIYTTSLENGIWTPIEKLNENINTKYWESHATISHDNTKLYFTSNRKGTIGGLDIYVSERDSTGEWGPAKNLGPVINTPYNEESPFLSDDDKTLFFSSRGHFNMGGYDIFYSTLLDNGEWSIPLNAGYPLNSTDDDVFFNPVNDGYEGYLALESPDGFGRQDIYRVEIFSDDHPRKFLVRGKVKVADLISIMKDSVKISALSILNPDQTVIVYSDPETGEYDFHLPHGEYQISYEAEGGEKVSSDLELPLLSEHDSFTLNGVLIPRTDFITYLKVLGDTVLVVENGDSIVFHLSVEPNSVLAAEHMLADSSMATKQYLITDDSSFYYKMYPYIGDNRIVLNLTDRFNNVASADLLITRKEEIIEQPVIRPEHPGIIAAKQINALLTALINRADGKLKKVIKDIDVSGQEFERADDLISLIKDEAAKSDIGPEETDLLALRVAVLDNILTQAAVNILGKYTTGELKEILDNIDIYELNLKTWTDLQKYIASVSGGEIDAEELNAIANAILMGVDPAILILREKVLAYNINSETGNILKQSVETVDQRVINLREIWLKALYDESLLLGLSDKEMAEMLAVISSLPGTEAEEYLNRLTEHSEESLLSYLKSLNLKKEKIRTPDNMLLMLFQNRDRGDFTEESLFRGVANLIIAEDIPYDTIASYVSPVSKKRSWLIPVTAISVVLLSLIIIIILRRRKGKEKKKE